MSNRLALRACCLVLASLVALVASDLPAVAAVADQAGLGVGVQRTMTRLATSTPEHRKRVRVLFYGQSITAQGWTALVGADLRARFPHADLEIVNKAIGGFASQLLVKTAEHDCYAFQPDLIIFHVYGGLAEYEEIIRNLRTRTTAEILMQTDHVGAKRPAMPADWAEAEKLQKADFGAWWDHMMNRAFLPDMAKKHGCGLADVRSAWLAYLDQHRLEPRALLSDDIHLNDHGCAVMAGIVSQYLVHRPDLPSDAWKDSVRDLEPQVTGRRLTLSGDGSRFDVVIGTVDQPIIAEVTIDGKKPSAFPGCYAITRPSPPPPLSPLSVIRIDHAQPLLVEDWTLTLTSVAADHASWTYTVTGSLTGDDGTGDSRTAFTSTSGRVVIAPDSWFKGFFSTGEGIIPGATITWQVVPMFADRVELTSGDAATERLVTLAQGLPNGNHTIVLTADRDLGRAVQAVRVHRPTTK